MHKRRPFHFSSFSHHCISPISFNLFILFIYYRSDIIGRIVSVVSLLVVAIFAYFPTLRIPHASPSLDREFMHSFFTKRNTPCCNTLLNIFRHCTCILPHHVSCLFVYCGVISWLGNNNRCFVPMSRRGSGAVTVYRLESSRSCPYNFYIRFKKKKKGGRRV